MRGTKWFICLLAVGLVIGVFPNTAPAEVVQIRMDCGPIGGGKNYRNEVIAEVVRKGNPKWVINCMSGPVLPVSLAMLNRGELEMSTTRPRQMHELREGILGGKPLGIGPVNLSWIAPCNYALMSFFVLKKVPVDSLDELVEKKYPINVSVGAPGSDPYIQASQIMSGFGVTFKDMKAWGAKLHHQHTGRSMKMVRDGIIVGKFHVGTIPMAAVEDLARARELKILGINSEKVITNLEKIGYERKVIPAGSYLFTPKELPTLGVPNLVVVRTDLSDETAYHIARGIWENREYMRSMHPVFKRNITKKVIAETYKRHADSAHPGAVKYWKEQGIVR